MKMATRTLTPSQATPTDKTVPRPRCVRGQRLVKAALRMETQGRYRMPPTMNPTSHLRQKHQCKLPCQHTPMPAQARRRTARSPSPVKLHQTDILTMRITATLLLLSRATDPGAKTFNIPKAVRCNARHFRPIPLFHSKDKHEERRRHSQYQMCHLSLPTTPTTPRLSTEVTVTRPTTHRHALQPSHQRSKETA